MFDPFRANPTFIYFEPVPAKRNLSFRLHRMHPRTGRESVDDYTIDSLERYFQQPIRLDSKNRLRVGEFMVRFIALDRKTQKTLSAWLEEKIPNVDGKAYVRLFPRAERSRFFTLLYPKTINLLLQP